MKSQKFFSIQKIIFIISVSTLIIILSFFSYFGMLSANWGFDFSDEILLYNTIAQSIKDRLLLPGWYNYPSLTYSISLISTLFYFLFENFNEITSIKNEAELKLYFTNLLDNSYIPVITYLRKIFIIISIFTAFFVYISCRLLNIRFSFSILSSALVLSSFPIFYHSRWVAPDTLLMISGISILTIFLWTRKNISFERIAVLSIISGIALSAKYPGGIFLIYPLIIANINKFSFKKNLYVIFIFCLTFYFITPGSIIQFYQFYADVNFEIFHYSEMGHFWHTINPGLEHFNRIIQFYAMKAFSSNILISLLFFILSCLGSFFLLRKDKLNFFAISFIPLFYVIYFSSMKVMIVRNLIVLIPFLAVLTGYALEKLQVKIKNIYFELVISIIFLLSIILSSQLFYFSTNSLNYTNKNFGDQIQKFINEEKNKKIAISNKAATYLGDNLTEIYSNQDLSNIDILIFVKEEFKLTKQQYLTEPYIGRFANIIGNYKVIAGPNEYDIDYYPYHMGKERIIAIYNESARLLSQNKYKGIVRGIIK